MIDELVLKTPLDLAAVGELYDAFYDTIYRYCLRRLYFRHVAEDAVSEIFLTMARRIGEFRGKRLRDFRAWLYVIAANHVNQLIRRKFRDKRLLDALAQQTLQRERGSRERRWAALYRALLALDEEQQHLISLRFFQGLSHDEIACIVGKRAGTVRVRIHRALKEIQPTLQRLLDDECVWEDGNGR
ncbi:MAG: sigma-70 family RNA polymerase sigma factor [Planctomycetota bacterium]|nr:sigma-70 family RNA polymerase sigma factor [Planctomycetota bacterium]